MKYRHIGRTVKVLRSMLVFATVLAAAIGCGSILDADDNLPQGRLTVVPGTHGDFLGDVMTTRPNSQVPAAVDKVIEEFLDQ